MIAADFFLPDTVEDVGLQAAALSDKADRGGRPPGDYRTVVMDTLSMHGPLPMRDIAAVRQIELSAVSRTVDNLRRAGLLSIVGYEKRAHCRRWVALYDMAQESPVVNPWPALMRWAHARSN